MKYVIKTKSDLFTGVSLIILIPEEDLDIKALNAMQEEKPEFILPFHVRHVDKCIELTYHIEAHCKLQYIAGDYGANEYVFLWASILSPLQECSDWHMKTYSFLLHTEHLYYDKSKKTVSYVYIPSLSDCSDYNDLKEMATVLTKQISVKDTALENKVLRIIMKEFTPKDFMLTLRQYTPEFTMLAIKPSIAEPLSKADVEPLVLSAVESESSTDGNIIKQDAKCAYDKSKHGGNSKQNDSQCRESAHSHATRQDDCRDFTINMPVNESVKKGSNAKNHNAKHVIDESKNANKNYGFFWFFRKKKDNEALNTKNAAICQQPHSSLDQSQLPTAKPKCITQLRPASPDVRLGVDTKPSQHNNQEVSVQAKLYNSHISAFDAQFTDDVTQSITPNENGGKLWLVGSILLPALIDVKMDKNEVFTIGRYDATIGRKQSSFEFERQTKAISRRHAAIERNEEKYNIIDLSSSAGTFVNGQKLPPNTPCQLSNGCRVSFGSSGADYVWEE